MAQSASSRAFVSVAAAALLAGCTTLGPNFHRPAAPQAAGYAMAGDPVPASIALTPETRAGGAWWKALGSPELDDVMLLALRDNPTGAEARANLERAEADARVAAADRLPKLDGNASFQRERINTAIFGITGFPSPTISLYTIGANVSYGLDLFGRTRRSIEAANADVQTARARADAAYLTLTGNVALRAAQIAAYREEVTALGAVIADDRASIEIVRKAEALGGETAVAGLGGQAQLQADLALAPSVESELAQARHELADLVGRPPGAWTAPDFTLASFHLPTSLALVVPSTLVRRRPDILAAEADLHAATARIGVAKAARYPTINLVAGYAQEALTPGSLFSFASSAYNFGPQITAPLFHAGALKAQQRAAEADARAADARYRQTVSTAFLQVANLLSSLAEDDRRLAFAQASERTAQANLRAANDAWRLGGGTKAQIVQAERNLHRIQLTGAEDRGLRLQDLIALQAAVATDLGDVMPKT